MKKVHFYGIYQYNLTTSTLLVHIIWTKMSCLSDNVDNHLFLAYNIKSVNGNRDFMSVIYLL